MVLAKVIGNVVSTHKNRHLTGHKLLIIRTIDLKGNFVGDADTIAIDTVDSGIGDTVIIVKEGDAVQQILGNSDTPVHTMIVGIVDDIDTIPEEHD